MKISIGENYLENAILDDDDTGIRRQITGKIYVFCGYPGSGKGTCGEIISRRLDIAHISTGDLFRKEVALKTPAGLEIAEYMAKGQFVPPELANTILANRLDEDDAKRGVILDGFPRSIEHLLDLDTILKPSNRRVEAAILLDIDESICCKRLSGRRHCPQCLKSYNIHSSPPTIEGKCNDCGTEIVQRTDDGEDIIKKRFDLAKSSLAPLLQELERRDNLYTLRIYGANEPHPEIVASKIIEIMAYPERFSCHQNLTACYRLSLHLNRLFTSRNEANLDEMKTLCVAYRDQVLHENSSKRTGIMRRFVYLSSENYHKYLEFIRVFDRYGIEVLQLPPLPDDINKWSPLMTQFVRVLLSCKSDSLVPLAILRESSVLLKPGVEPSLINGVSDSFEVGVEIPAFDSSILFDHALRSTGRNGVHANHLSVLTSIWIPVNGSYNQKVCGKFYCHLSKGRIEESGGTSNSPHIHLQPVFGWDDKFILLETNESYHSHREKGLKISSRDMVISLFLQDRIYYKHFLNLKHAPQSLTRPVDFNVDVADFVANQEYYQTPYSKLFGLQNLLTHVLNEGIFFKGADTRLEANYWQPGLNAGLPLIAKKDPVHEKTFMFHDFGHFLMKDLIYTGINTPLHRHVYIMHRMMSESITIMMADGLFVDSMKKSKVDYDFTTRKIYPLFCALWGSNLEEEQNVFPTFSEDGTPIHRNKEKFISKMKAILKASVDYTVKGDDRSFKALLQKNLTKVLESEYKETESAYYRSLMDYKIKYKPFFVSDFNWTVHNYENMSNRSNEMRLWWELTSPVRDLFDLPLETIDEFTRHLSDVNRAMNHSLTTGGGQEEIDHLDGEVYLADAHPLNNLIDNVFEIIFTRNIEPIFNKMDADPLPLEPAEIRIKRGFYRYIIGQMGIFSRFWSVPETKECLQELIHKLQSNEPISTVRLCYEEYLELLLHKNLISKDDCHNFKDIYPLFEPFYVTYDDNVDAYPNLQHLSHHLLSNSLYRQTQEKQIEKFLKRKLNKKEAKFCSRMGLLIESSGGRIDEGIFVTEPGVILLAHTQYQPLGPENQHFEILNDGNIHHATFLLVGISLETSLEFIAHHEASIARLTSSKTAAMNIPYYRVQETGNNHSNMISYLKLQQIIRTQYEVQEKPGELWTHGIELFNITQSGCKSTALTYTMAIKDFHKLFIGRMGESGNENEVRTIVHRMADILQPLYPDQILFSHQYLALSNGEKYILRPLPVPHISAALWSLLEKCPCQLISETTLTPRGINVFQNLNIDMSGTQYEQIAEFSSRITYLAFADHTPGIHSSKSYLDKMIHEYQHRSIVSAIRVSYLLLLDFSTSFHEDHTEMWMQSIWKAGGTVTECSSNNQQGQRCVILTANLKVLHTLFKEWSQILPPMGIIRQIIDAAHDRFGFAIDHYSVYYD